MPTIPPLPLGSLMPLATRNAEEPKKLARMLRAHLDGVLVWTKLRVSNGALEGSCAALPLP
jgi:hypothetical protein